jgi:hypothetical protein
LKILAGPDLVGVCSLAVGADQIFAKALLAAGGRLHVILPSANYNTTFNAGDELANYSDLVSSSSSVEELPFPGPSEEAFFAAGRQVVDQSDLLFAVWDGAPAAGLGGTADIVQYAKDSGTVVEIIWPPGARRS